MSSIKSFEDIEAWKEARELCGDIFQLTLTGSFSKDYGLRDQINRSSGSVMDNIVEGFERGGTKEFIQFLSYARGSAGEGRSQLYRALDRKYIAENEFGVRKERCLKISKMITNFMIYLRDSEIKGMKFQEPQKSYQTNL
jgi:four helix bundle protein